MGGELFALLTRCSLDVTSTFCGAAKESDGWFINNCYRHHNIDGNYSFDTTVASTDGRRHHVIEVLASWALGLPGPTRLDDTPAPGSNPTCSIKSVH